MNRIILLLLVSSFIHCVCIANESNPRAHKKHRTNKHEGDKHREDSKSIGTKKAITVIDIKEGFKLSPEAIKTFSLGFKNVVTNLIQIKKSTLVVSRDLKGIYRLRDGFFKLIPVRIISENASSYKIDPVDIIIGDQIVIKGIDLLRIADIYSTDKSDYGHSH